MATISREEIEDRLAVYVSELASAAAETDSGADRKAYTSHMAEAAKMFTAVRRSASLAELKELVANERHGFGRGYLSGDCGNRAETAFDKFASFIEALDDAG